MSGHADTIRDVLGHSINGAYSRELAARSLNALLAENRRLREKAQRVLDSFETTGFEEGAESLLALIALREALAGDTE